MSLPAILNTGSGGGGGTGSGDGGMDSDDGSKGSGADSTGSVGADSLELRNQVLVQNQNLILVHLNQFSHYRHLSYKLSSSSFHFTLEHMLFWVKVLGYLS
ncbi:hypothetical protein NP83_07170 [Neobacillus niacini]|nr:hypothetical protein NP83_07170 [Neobacillus niacini]